MVDLFRIPENKCDTPDCRGGVSPPGVFSGVFRRCTRAGRPIRRGRSTARQISERRDEPPFSVQVPRNVIQVDCRGRVARPGVFVQSNGNGFVGARIARPAMNRNVFGKSRAGNARPYKIVFRLVPYKSAGRVYVNDTLLFGLCQLF